jgi:hypothetical protein
LCAPKATVEVSSFTEFCNDEAEGVGIENIVYSDGIIRVAGLLTTNFVAEQMLLINTLEYLPVYDFNADQLVRLSVYPHVSLARHPAANPLIHGKLIRA